MKVIIIGGSAGGASVAARLRRLDETSDIILIERNESISFATCGIPYYLGDVINDHERLDVVDKDEFRNILNIDLRTNYEALSINREHKMVLLRNVSNGKICEERYDKLVLSPGGSAIVPDIDGIKSDNVSVYEMLKILIMYMNILMLTTPERH